MDTNKDKLAATLRLNHKAFADKIRGLDESRFMYAPAADKWTAGQQLAHLVSSIEPVNLAFALPRFVPRLLFGKANRPSKSYTELVEKYQLKLQAGGRASGRFVPKAIPFSQKDKLLQKLDKEVQKLSSQIAKTTEKDLDTYILPHPLLGKLTFREMLYFTAYHAAHHLNIVERDLGNPSL